jgi:uncharacterized membrane protein YphA (DoxX/SURF4 family)
MTIAAAVLSILIAAIALASAWAKFTKNPRALEAILGVGVREAQVPILGGLEVLGAIAVLLGFALPWLGVAGAIGLTLYFVGAVIAHLRVHDGPDKFAPVVVLAAIAAAAAITRALTI